MSERIYSSAAAARYIGVNKKTIIKYCKARQITFMVYPSGSYRFRQTALDIWLASHTHKAA